jgi:hypothetical protein
MEMNEIYGHKRFKEKVLQLTPSGCTALAAACLKRVLPILQNYRGTDTPFVKYLDWLWNDSKGEESEARDFVNGMAECKKIIEKLYEKDEIGATLNAANGFYFAVESLRTAEKLEKLEKLFDSIMEAREAAGADADEYESNVAEEALWQQKALGIVATASEINRELFDSIAIEPAWLQRYRNNEWIER